MWREPQPSSNSPVQQPAALLSPISSILQTKFIQKVEKRRSSTKCITHSCRIPSSKALEQTDLKSLTHFSGTTKLDKRWLTKKLKKISTDMKLQPPPSWYDPRHSAMELCWSDSMCVRSNCSFVELHHTCPTRSNLSLHVLRTSSWRPAAAGMS